VSGSRLSPTSQRASPDALTDPLDAVQHAFWVATGLLLATTLSTTLMITPSGRTSHKLGIDSRAGHVRTEPPPHDDGPAAP